MLEETLAQDLLCLDMENVGAKPFSSVRSKPFSSLSASRSGGRGLSRDFRKGGTSPSNSDRIAALGRLLTRILRHMAVELNLKIRSDGYVCIRDLLQLDITTYAKVPLKSHTIEEIKEAVRRDNKSRFSLLEEGGELLIRANQGHSITTVTSENLLRPILSADEVQICVHGTYRKNLKSILQSGLKRMNRLHVHFASGMPDGEVISGMRRDIDILIFLDVGRALNDGMKLYFQIIKLS
ncbi:hypothetical protein HPP92_008230 [Vanilla planifolia]|uniref:2'-phosphotransferase n=1 Tax=Vanilla planifolia TaxID=51239 RepID=A0A835RI45_VANPL|nr:hypothetical protein HPP92_008230 [Vanilla planifolia]